MRVSLRASPRIFRKTKKVQTFKAFLGLQQTGKWSSPQPVSRTGHNVCTEFRGILTGRREGNPIVEYAAVLRVGTCVPLCTLYIATSWKLLSLPSPPDPNDPRRIR